MVTVTQAPISCNSSGITGKCERIFPCSLCQPTVESDCGTVLVGPGGKVLLFGEKTTLDGSRYINAGIYVLSRQTIDQLPERCSNLA